MAPVRPPLGRPAIACLAAAAAYLVAGAAAMLLLAPRTPYADQWRLYAKLLQQPFLAGVVSADNGHREVLPNLVRWITLHGLDGQSAPAIVLGLLLALAAAGIWLRSIAGARIDAGRRAAAALIAVLGLFWLGNERALAHDHESVRVYLIVLCLFGALVQVARPQPTPRATAAATLLALLATLSFGSGIASFAAIALVLALGRARPAAWAVLLAGLATALALYLGGATASVTGTLVIDPAAQAIVLLRWLATPFVYVLWPLVDPAVAGQLPGGGVARAATAIAVAFTNLFGPVQTSPLPQALVGAAGGLALLAASWRAWRAPPDTDPARRVALGIAWFGLAVGGLVAISRSGYFIQFPDQVHAPRYLPWSSLFWAGLLVAAVLRPGGRLRPAAVLVVALLVLPSTFWMALLARSMQVRAEQVATAAAVGVLPPDLALGETVADELAAALPLLADRGIAMYAWPEVRCLGKPVQAGAVRPVTARELHVETTGNRLGQPGLRITYREDEDDAAGRRMILDAGGILRGLALPDPAAGPGRWHGWATDAGANAEGFSPLIVQAVGEPLCEP